MDQMLESIARAMSTTDKGVDHWEVMSEDGDGYGYVGKNEYRAMARTAIEWTQGYVLEYSKSFAPEDYSLSPRETLEKCGDLFGAALK